MSHPDYSKWTQAKGGLREASSLLGLIGKSQRTTAKGVGSLHSVTVKTMIHHQETDGAKNYHESKAFDEAMAFVVRKRFAELSAEAIELMKSRVATSGAEARASIEEMLAEIDAANEH